MLWICCNVVGEHHSCFTTVQLRLLTSLALDPVVEANLRSKLLDHFVTKDIIPNIVPSAKAKAYKLLNLIDLILPRSSVPMRRNLIEGVVFSSNTQTDIPDTVPVDVPAPRVAFRKTLETMFEVALAWRADKNKKVKEKWSFDFPGFEQTFQTARMIDVSDVSGAYADRQEQYNTIILCMMPVTWRATRQKLGGRWSKPEKVLDGIVLGY